MDQLNNKYMITQEKLRTDLPPIEEAADGSCNVVLALVDVNTYYCKTNTYIPPWQICNTVYYNLHPGRYVGWYPLEFVQTPPQDQLPEPDFEKEDAVMRDIFGSADDVTE
jgi:hypothetical protein